MARDDVALRLIASFLRPLNRGDQLWFDLDLTEESYTGNVHRVFHTEHLPPRERQVITPIQPCDVDTVWPTIARLIKRACNRSGDVENVDDLREKCKRPGHMLILFPGGAAILQRDANWLHMVSLGGKGFLKQIPDLMPVWRDIATATGCEGLSLKGRKGWARVLEKYGFKPAANDYLEAHHGCRR